MNDRPAFSKIGEHNIDLQLSNPKHHKRIAEVARALSNTQRLQILNVLKDTVLNIQEIARTLGIPLSTTAQHIKILEDAELVVTETRPGAHGSMRLCTCNMHSFTLQTYEADRTSNEKTIAMEMGVGQYYSCEVSAPCGLADGSGTIDGFDSLRAFYFPQRSAAQLLWFHQGYVEYRFPNICNPFLTLQEISFSMELCSEAPGHQEIWPSDITVSVNGHELTTYTSPGDFGNRRGNITPDIWPNGSTQYGLLKLFAVRADGVYLDGHSAGSHVTLDDLKIGDGNFITLRVEIKKDARNVGGVNLFGETYGDHPQGILMRLTY